MSAGSGDVARSIVSVHVRKQFPVFTLAADFDAPSGITILFGRSGSGKTTILQCIAGLVQPDAGRIAIGNCAVFDNQRRLDIPTARRNVGYVFQELALFPHLTAEQNIAYGLNGVPASERRERVRAILELFRIGHLASRKPAQLSGGERQRVALARSLVTEPRALLLDEPLAALDLPTQSALMDDLRRWNRAHDVPIIYVTHNQREVFALGERVIVVDEGKVIAQGSPHEVLRSPRQETVAHLAGFENIFDAQVIAVNESHGTMTCRLGSSAELEVPLTQTTAGESVRIALNAGDILLATERPRGLSARNLLPGKLVALDQQGITVHGRVDCGVMFHVKLTPTARDSLSLRIGNTVWLVIKTYSCHLLEPPTEDT